jgi:hypothetical protein
MFSHKLPWDGLSDTAVVAQVMQKNYPGSRNHCSNCAEVDMSDETWCLLESCWTIYANIRPGLPQIREDIMVLKKAHDVSVTHDISRPQLLRRADMSRKLVGRKESSKFASHPSASDMFSNVPSASASGRVAPLRYRYLGRPGPIYGRSSPYNPGPRSGRDRISARVPAPYRMFLPIIRCSCTYINHR